jgi:hypothetical protein
MESSYAHGLRATPPEVAQPTPRNREAARPMQEGTKVFWFFSSEKNETLRFM